MAASALRALSPDEFDYWKAQHLLNRAGFGGSPEQVRAIANMGVDDAVDFIVDYHDHADDPIEADLFDPNIMRPLTPAEQQEYRQARRNGNEAVVEKFRRLRQERQRADRRQIAEMQRWWLEKMIETPRPLQEKMTLFWHGHFATSYRTIENSYHIFVQNQLLRHHAVGNFREMTHAIVRDPAMIRYLDNNQNRKQSPNENLARELMELFTLGEGNDYTENDIKEGARALTGYTYYDDAFIGKESQQYRNQHDFGGKRILGQVGDFDGDDFVGIIFSRPVCSEFICWKLYRFFVNDMPGDPADDGQEYVVALARLFRRQNYDIKPVMKAMFKSRHFYDASNMHAKIKSPIQLIVQAIRSLRAPSRSLNAMLSASDLMGQNILYPPSVKGWQTGRAWINTSTLFVRHNVMVYLLTGQRPNAYPWDMDGATCDLTHLLDHFDKPLHAIDVREGVTYLVWFNLGQPPHDERVDALVEHVRARGGRFNNTVLIELMSLITAMPEYQLC